MARYALEFGALGDTRPVPDLTVQTTDLNVLDRAVVEHARPHITPVLTALGRPELADCLFRMNKDRTMGQFLHLDLARGCGVQFLAVRITTTPERIQRKRTKGWTSPSGAKYVGRPSRWGNPFPACGDSVEERAAVTGFFGHLINTRSAHPHPEHVVPYPSDDEIRDELRGRDLMCWCPLPEPGQPDYCHAAVLLKLANAPKESQP
ncbi:DUF4326 domain-containing protein [[Kitasatospora] papulosa]|uniref:DUF4326 domain-containing protein n=1 Tax=[Kitasatospora] papulosa TaxID=1464011 RepID=UPI00403CF003